jgi:hypothetical protein
MFKSIPTSYHPSQLLNNANTSNVLQSPFAQSLHPALQKGMIQGLNQYAPPFMQQAMQQPALQQTMQPYGQQPMQPVGQQPMQPAVQQPMQQYGQPVGQQPMQQAGQQPAMQPAVQPAVQQYGQPVGQQAMQSDFSKYLPQGGQMFGIPTAQNAMHLPQVGNSFVPSLLNKLPEGLLSPDTKTQLEVIGSNPIGNIVQVPSVFNKITKDVEKKLLVTVLERFKTILELFKQPASDAVNALLKKELDALTENMNDPSLRPIVDKLSRAAEIPIQRFLDNITAILQRYFPALVGKLFNTAGNVIGEIPVVGVFVNAALAFSNVLNTVTTASTVFDKTTKQMESFQNELTNALNTLVNDTHAQVDQALDPTSIMKKNASAFGHSGFVHKGGSTSRGKHKMHTLKRIHTSIKQFIHTNKRTLKQRYKKPRRH